MYTAFMLFGDIFLTFSFIINVWEYIKMWSTNLKCYSLQNNKLNGPAMIFAANGDRIELSYEDGVVNGKATIKGKIKTQ